MSRHTVTLTVTVEMEIEPEVIERALTAEWQADFYQMASERDVLKMLAWNIGCRDVWLSRLDGWADLPDSAVDVLDLDVELD